MAISGIYVMLSLPQKDGTQQEKNFPFNISASPTDRRDITLMTACGCVKVKVEFPS